MAYYDHGLLKTLKSISKSLSLISDKVCAVPPNFCVPFADIIDGPTEREVVVKPGFYRHFKGDCYRVLGVVQRVDTDTPEMIVLYRKLHCSDDTIFARSVKNFTEEVDHKKYPDCKQKYKFVRI